MLVRPVESRAGPAGSFRGGVEATSDPKTIGVPLLSPPSRRELCDPRRPSLRRLPPETPLPSGQGGESEADEGERARLRDSWRGRRGRLATVDREESGQRDRVIRSEPAPGRVVAIVMLNDREGATGEDRAIRRQEDAERPVLVRLEVDV